MQPASVSGSLDESDVVYIAPRDASVTVARRIVFSTAMSRTSLVAWSRAERERRPSGGSLFAGTGRRVMRRPAQRREISP